MANHEVFMSNDKINFNDGAGYEKMMGIWSRLAGEVFLDWLAPAAGQRWVDVGCGNGAFTELLVQRCAPAAVEGFDPSEAQLAFARTRPAAQLARFRLGDAMAAPYPDASFDVAVMALVIVFVPQPERGVAEMVRMVRPGGSVSAYIWDLPGGGFPLQPLLQGMREMGMKPPSPPSEPISRREALHELWANAGLKDVETRVISVTREFTDFEDFWSTAMLAQSVSAAVKAMDPNAVQRLKECVREKMRTGSEGSIAYTARANAVRGRR
jgi:ubiquinone/menaquinone biosynthesis C-methylase UbiE